MPAAIGSAVGKVCNAASLLLHHMSSPPLSQCIKKIHKKLLGDFYRHLPTLEAFF